MSAHPATSLAVVGARYPNKRGPGRLFEIRLCVPGEPVELRPEPKNPVDSRAIGVYSARDVQIGYIRAEQAQWIRKELAGGNLRAIFQGIDDWGANIRVTFDGSDPVLPPARSPLTKPKVSDWPPPDPEDQYGGI